jgi:hypothetical protein
MLLCAGLVMVPAAPSASAAVDPVDNPAIQEQCGVDATLVLDASGSVSSAGAVNQVRDAAEAFLDALSNTGSTARVTQFGTVSAQLAASTVVSDASLGPGGALRAAVEGYYNPRPPRPPGVNFINTSGNVNNNTSNNQYTNWDGSLHQAAETTPNIVVYVTDGDPTAYDLDQAGDPGDPGPPPDIRYGTDSNETQTIDRAVIEANRVKTQGSRMLVVGVGNALSSQSSQNRLRQISGPQVVRDGDLADIDSLNEVDVALVTEFDDLAAFLRSVVLQLCSPSLTIQKLAQSATSTAYAPVPGWNMTVTPRVPSGSGFTWILPDTTPAAFKTEATDANGLAQFQWEPIPADADSAATVSEALQPDYIAGRPGPSNDFSCELKDEEGNVRTVTGELNLSNPSAPAFDLDPIGQEIVTCKVFNSYDYRPAINVEKVNNPTSLRGDLEPPASVTSTYAVTNPGNTPLSNVSVDDDVCGGAAPVPPTGPNVGDTNPRDGRLQPGEIWQFVCTREVSTAASTDPDGETITNTATASGSPPSGLPVTDTDTATVTAFTPAIEVAKLANGQEVATVVSASEVAYTYRVSNAGNTPLSPVTLTDDTAPCSTATNLVRGPDDPGNGDNILGPTEVWTYSCTVPSVTASVLNTATVSGIPLDPATGQPFPAPNPSVTDDDPARVVVVNPDISLDKSVTPSLVLLPQDGTPQEVTYTFTATNPGDAPLNRPGASTGGPGTRDPGWVGDRNCSPVTYASGDTDGDSLLDRGETWLFTCQKSVSQPIVNVAVIVGQPSLPNGDPIPNVGTVTAAAVAFVDVVRPGIAITKTAVRGVVVDPDAAAVSGPDVPRRPAVYTYDLRNTGDVPLVIGPGQPTDDICGPLVPAARGLGDDDGDELLDVGEVWHYTCTTTLERQQSNSPPLSGNESGLVTNTARVTGVPFFEGEPFPEKAVSAQDIAQVLVIEPGISITKTATPTGVQAGRDVTYTFVVSNTGDVGLAHVVPVDDKCSPLVRTGGDNGNDLLDGVNSGAAESWTYTCTRTIGLPEGGATADVNTVTVSGTDPQGNRYEATDTAEVKVIDPAISLEKSVSDELVLSGSTVTYTFEVTNTGGSPVAADDVLDSVLLGDASEPANPACARPSLVAKEGGNQDDVLDREPAELWRYTCQGTITETTVDVAGVEGIGGRTIDEEVPVFDFATAHVTAFHPGIEVVKSATPQTLVDGGTVNYTYNVRNTGDVPLADVASRITDDTCSPVQYASGDLDGDQLLDTANSIFEDALDETWVFTCSAFVDEDTTNTVVVTGTPTDPEGEALCDPASENGAAAAASTCDPTSTSIATVTVTAAPEPPGPPGPPPLPETGVPNWTIPLGQIGLALLLVGAGLVWWSRTRRRVLR